MQWQPPQLVILQEAKETHEHQRSAQVSASQVILLLDKHGSVSGGLQLWYYLMATLQASMDYKDKAFRPVPRCEQA